jgi:hypothetical protein
LQSITPFQPARVADRTFDGPGNMEETMMANEEHMSRFKLTVLGFLGFIVMLSVSRVSVARAEDNGRFRWDMVHIVFHSTGNEAFAGGQDSARANDGSKITLTGTGTFEVGDPENVSGGGTWQTFDSTGTPIANGTYEVKRLIRFDVAPGTQTSSLIDHIGDGTLTDNIAGLAFLTIEYSDDSSGILTVSCHLNGGPGPAAPATVFEGSTASKGFVDYWNREAPVNGVDADRTLFHILSTENEQ